MRFDGLDDTPPHVREMVIERYRRMSPMEKLQRMAELSRGVREMAKLRIRAEHPEADERELQLRVAALYIPANLMKAAFDWPPDDAG